MAYDDHHESTATRRAQLAGRNARTRGQLAAVQEGKPMSVAHDNLVAEIQRRADQRGLLSHYCQRSTACKGSRGLPDLIVAGTYGTVFIEVKTGGADPAVDQTTWLHTLRAGGQDVAVIREADLEDGSLDELLRTCAGTRVV